MDDGAAPRVRSTFGGVDFPLAHLPRSAPREGTRRRPLPKPGSYMTDGIELYRVVRWQVSAAGDAAQLEDCRTLDVRPYGVRELGRMPLRPVRPRAQPA
jgi:hypothetical protein